MLFRSFRMDLKKLLYFAMIELSTRKDPLYTLYATLGIILIDRRVIQRFYLVAEVSSHSGEEDSRTVSHESETPLAH